MKAVIQDPEHMSYHMHSGLIQSLLLLSYSTVCHFKGKGQLPKLSSHKTVTKQTALNVMLLQPGFWILNSWPMCNPFNRYLGLYKLIGSYATEKTTGYAT